MQAKNCPCFTPKAPASNFTPKNKSSGYVPKSNAGFTPKATPAQPQKPVIKSVITISEQTDYEQIYPQLLEIAKNYKDNNSLVPAFEEYFKPCTQLTNIEPYMNLLPEHHTRNLVEALQFVDAAWNIVHWDTRGSAEKHKRLVADCYFNELPIGYEWSAFGRYCNKYGANKWNVLYETTCSMSNFRHSCKKAHKVLFTYYCMLAALDDDPTIAEREIVQYITGAVQYAIHVMLYMREHHSSTMEYFGYVWTLATFYNGLRSRIPDEEKTVVPYRFIFTSPRKFRNMDSFAKVNNLAVKKFLSDTDGTMTFDKVFPEDGFAGGFAIHSYKYPQCATMMPRNDDIVFYDPHDVCTDIPATDAFLTVIMRLKEVLPSRNFTDVLYTLDDLDAFEACWLVPNDTEVDCTPNPFYKDLESAKAAAGSVVIPDDVKNANVWFVCSVVTRVTNGKNTEYSLFMINRDGRVLDQFGNDVKPDAKICY